MQIYIHDMVFLLRLKHFSLFDLRSHHCEHNSQFESTIGIASYTFIVWTIYTSIVVICMRLCTIILSQNGSLHYTFAVLWLVTLVREVVVNFCCENGK